jgi:hypothetical protein
MHTDVTSVCYVTNVTLLTDVPRVTSAMERPLDGGISREVELLRQHGVETFESCEGGAGHPFVEPTVRFHGDATEGFRVLALALKNGLRVDQLRRYYQIQDGEPTGPYWELTFVKP